MTTSSPRSFAIFCKNYDELAFYKKLYAYSTHTYKTIQPGARVYNSVIYAATIY